MGDIGKRSAVHECGRSAESLHEVGLYRVFKKGCHRSYRFKVACGNGLVVVGIGDDYSSEAFFKIAHVACKTENRHNFGGDGNIVAVFTRDSVSLTAQAVHNETKLTIVHVHAAFPGDFSRVDTERVALIDVIVEHCRKQVVCRSYCVKVTRKVQIDVFHRHYLRISAACRSAFYSEYRPERRLAKSDDRLLSDEVHGVA